MKINRQQLQKYKNQPLVLDQEIKLDDESLQPFEDRFIDISPIKVDGQVSIEKNDDVIVRLKIQGLITLPSSRSQEPVVYPIDVEINEIYIEDSKDFERYANNDSIFLLDEHHLNIDKIIIDNIFTSIPITILTEKERIDDSAIQGKGWKLYKENEI